VARVVVKAAKSSTAKGKVKKASRKKVIKPPTPHRSNVRPPKLDAKQIPNHVAIVMDGNGRWAKQRGLARTAGHEAGELALVDIVHGAKQLTKNNKVLTLNMCINYGGRAEVLDAAVAIAKDAMRKKVKPDLLTEKSMAKYLYAPDMSDVDLFLRSSGEQRTSNFLMWQSAYAEMVFMDVLWPDADRRTLWRAIEIYAERERRFGKA